MWETFDRLVLEGHTLSNIKDIFADAEDNFLESYHDISLLKRMIRICRSDLPLGV